MIIQYCKALLNKVLKLIDAFYRVERTNEKPDTLLESVEKNFPKDQEKIFQIIQRFLKKTSKEKDGTYCYSTNFQSKHNGLITIKVLNYKIQDTEGFVQIRTQVKISNDQGKVIDYI